MRKTFMNIAIALEERKQLKASVSRSRARNFRFVKILGFAVLCLACLGVSAFCFGGQLLPRNAPAACASSASKWREVEMGSKDFTQAAAVSLDIFEAVERRDSRGFARALGRSIPPEMGEEFAGTIGLLNGGPLSVQTVRKRNDVPEGRYEVLCNVPGNGHRLRLLLSGEGGSLKLTGTDMAL